MIRPRVLLADDHVLLLDAFQKLLADECDIVGTVSDGLALVEAVEKLGPDVVVVDIAMPLLNGIDATRRIKRHHPATRIVIVTMNEDADIAAEAFRVGVSGYLLKRSAGSEMLTAIREVAKGRSYVTPLITESLFAAMLRRSNTGQPGEELTTRQREVIQLVAEGRSMKEAAAVLNIAPRTVAFHKYRVMEHLGVRTTAELVRFAVKHHIVGSSQK